jgi:hypothetical protein
MFSVPVSTSLRSISRYFVSNYVLKHKFLDFRGTLYRTSMWRGCTRTILTWSNRQVTLLATLWGQLFVELVWSTRGKLSHDVSLPCYYITTTTHGLNVGLVSRSASIPRPPVTCCLSSLEGISDSSVTFFVVFSDTDRYVISLWFRFAVFLCTTITKLACISRSILLLEYIRGNIYFLLLETTDHSNLRDGGTRFFHRSCLLLNKFGSEVSKFQRSYIPVTTRSYVWKFNIYFSFLTCNPHGYVPDLPPLKKWEKYVHPEVPRYNVVYVCMYILFPRSWLRDIF